MKFHVEHTFGASVDRVGERVSTCERVSLTLDGELGLQGEVRAELGDEIGVGRPRAVDAGLAGDPADRVGALVSTCERVSLTLDGELVLQGEVWAELGDEIDAARQRAVDAGLAVDPPDVGEERVKVTLQP
jgi:hypothetical protein